MSKSASDRTRKRGKNWSYIFEAGKTAEGKRKVIEIGITSEKITVKDFMKNWLENVVALNVRPTTFQEYKSLFNLRIVSQLGNFRLTELTPAILYNWIRNLQKARYSKNTLSHAHALLHHALDYAVYPAKLISSNPANHIKVPKKAPTNIVKRHIISQEQFAALLEKYPFSSPFYIPILILFYTGLGLTWEDIDFETKTITLSRQIFYIAKRGYFFSTLKTEASNRYIVIDDFLIAELKRWKSQQAENEKTFGNSYIYAYKTAEGKLVQQSKVLEYPDCEKISLVCTYVNGNILKKLRIATMLKQNDLNALSSRHTHATILAENGANPFGLSARLGHSNLNLTQNTYVHYTEKMQKDTANIFEKILHTKN